jgi:hypothetical protein
MVCVVSILQEKIMQYKELSEAAQVHAFKMFQEYMSLGDYGWWENTMGYWVEKLEALGIYTSLEQMHFSGFGSQVDGACFTGSINLKQFLEAHPDLKKEHVKLYMAVIPFDGRGAACECFDLELTRHGSTNYNHEKSVHLGGWDLNILPELDDDEGEDYERLIIDAEADIEGQCREYMKELHRDLEKDYEYLQSMECFLEDVNYKDFDEEGELT